MVGASDAKDIATHLYEISSGTSLYSPNINLELNLNKSFIISILGYSGPTKWLAIKNSLKKTNKDYNLIELNAIYYNDDTKLLKQFLIELEKTCGCIPATNVKFLTYKQRFIACLDILTQLKKIVVLVLLNADKCVKPSKRGKVSKQVFLYTLMDSTTKDSPFGLILDINDLLFNEKLEKRVKSRFTSNFEYITPTSKEAIKPFSDIANTTDEELDVFLELISLYGYECTTSLKQILYSKLLNTKLKLPFSQTDYVMESFPSLGIYEHLVLICLTTFHMEMKPNKTLFMILDEAKRLYSLDNEKMPATQAIRRAFSGLINQNIIEWSLVESKVFISISNTPCRFPLYKVYKDMVLDGRIKIPTNMIKWLT